MEKQAQVTQTAQTIDPVKFLQLYQELEMLDEYAFEFVLGTVKGLTAAKLMAALRNKEEKA